MDRRQLSSTTSTAAVACTPFTLPSNGLIELAASSVLTLTSNAVFKPQCTGTSDNILILTNANTNSHTSTLTDFRDPFYASTLPACYALAACTVIAYMLFVMLIITPRTFLVEGAVILGRRGFTNGPAGSDAGIGIGGRPWLQKVAAATVAISLTIATADTLRVAEQQYNQGFQDATVLQNTVEDGTELKVIRVISDTFLWLAQAQTLIRLFPRQREKIIIKWTAFALITLDVLFGILNNFVYEGSNHPQSFVDAVPALAYLFQLALSLLYCAWVMYYAIMKKRFAFYHSQMRNICLVALLSLVSVLVPVVFFVLDISKPTLAGWGDYVRWVGAAAASVVVWEWVERIEALERNDRKDGILGREVFDGDEMLEVTPSADPSWTKQLKNTKDDDDSGGGAATGINGRWPGMSNLANRYKARFNGDVEAAQHGPDGIPERGLAQAKRSLPLPPLWPTRPAPVATPISRTETASAESTVYAVRYHPISETTPPIPEPQRQPPRSRSNSVDVIEFVDVNAESSTKQLVLETSTHAAKPVVVEETTDQDMSPTKPSTWQTIAKVNPFRRRNQGLPPEVSAHAIKPQETTTAQLATNKWDVRSRIEEFAAAQAEKLSQRNRSSDNDTPLPVTVIPAPVRRRNLLGDLEEIENEDRIVPVVSDTTTATEAPPLTDTTFVSSQSPSSTPQQTQRSSNPYSPDIVSRHGISHRGSVSFVSPGAQRLGESSRALSPVELQLVERSGVEATSTVSTSQSGPLSRQNWVSNPRPLPTISIAAPRRRPRSEDDE